MTLRQKPNLSKPNQTKPLPQVAQLKGMGFADERAMRHALAHVNLVNGTFGGGAPATSLFESVRTAERRRNANEKAAPVRRASPSGGKQRRLPVFGVRASVAVAR